MTAHVSRQNPDKMEACVVDRVILADFIETYKDLPCLWDRTLPIYKNVLERKKAWIILAKKLKNLDPDANVVSAKKKMEHMKSAYQREVKRIKESTKTATSPDEIHKPSLWYFDMLRFLDKNEEIREESSKRRIKRRARKEQKHRNVISITVSSEDDNEPLNKIQKTQTESQERSLILEQKKQALVDLPTASKTQIIPTNTLTHMKSTPPLETKPLIRRLTHNPTLTPTLSMTPTLIRPPKHTTTRPQTHTQTRTQQASTHTSTSPVTTPGSPRDNPHPSIAYGLYVSEKLDEVSTEQRIIAEKLISDVIFLARTNNLCFNSRIEAGKPDLPIQDSSQQNTPPHLFMQIEPLINVSPTPNSPKDSTNESSPIRRDSYSQSDIQSLDVQNISQQSLSDIQTNYSGTDTAMEIRMIDVKSLSSPFLPTDVQPCSVIRSPSNSRALKSTQPSHITSSIIPNDHQSSSSRTKSVLSQAIDALDIKSEVIVKEEDKEDDHPEGEGSERLILGS